MSINHTLVDSITFLIIRTLAAAGDWNERYNELSFTNEKYIWRFRFEDNYADTLMGSRRQRLFNFIQLVIDEVTAEAPYASDRIRSECLTLEANIIAYINEEAWTTRENVGRIHDSLKDWLQTLGRL